MNMIGIFVIYNQTILLRIMDEEQLREVYEMVDGVNFSRTKKNINRDFSDGVMMAQLIAHYRPKAVQLHSYPAASSVSKKIDNWNTLNNKVLKRLGVGLSRRQIQDIVNCVPLSIQNYLYVVLHKFQSPAEQVNIRQQIKKSQPDNKMKLVQAPKTPQENIMIQGNNAGVSGGEQKEGGRQTKPNIMLGNQSDQVFKLIQQIEEAYAQLLKLQQMSKLKDQVIKNLQKKIEKLIFS